MSYAGETWRCGGLEPVDCQLQFESLRGVKVLSLKNCLNHTTFLLSKRSFQVVPGNIFVLGCSAVSSKPVLYIYIYIYIYFFFFFFTQRASLLYIILGKWCHFYCILLKLIKNSWGQLPTTRCIPHHMHVFRYPMKNCSIPLSLECGIYH